MIRTSKGVLRLYTRRMQSLAPAVSARPRAFVGVAGPQALDYLQRMVSNDLAALSVGESCEALLLTP